MQIRVLLVTLLAFAITALAAVPGSLESRHDDHHHHHHKFPCHWYGKAPHCKGYCPHGTFFLTSGKGGCRNGKHCKTGEKWLCCKDHFKWPKCQWYGTAPKCDDSKCPNGTYEVARDGDDCKKGCCKVFCCKKHRKHHHKDDHDDKYDDDY